MIRAPLGACISSAEIAADRKNGNFWRRLRSIQQICGGRVWAARAHVGSSLSGVSVASPLDREEPKITTDLLERYGCLLMLSARLHPEQAVRQEPLSIFGSSWSNHCEFRVGCYHAVMHKAVNQTTLYSAIDAVSIVSDRSFPRHSHDEFGIGIMEARGQYSWSGRGSVEARAGDVMTVNPGEIHDGLGTCRGRL